MLYGPQANEVLAVDQSVSGQGTVPVWTFADALGTVRTLATVGADGKWSVQARAFDEFGGAVRIVNKGMPALDAIPYYWAGHRRDTLTGLYWMHARWYDAHSQRFVSVDPLGFAAGDTNLYRYAFNSPTNFVDPDGREPITLTIAALAVIGGGIWANVEANEMTRALDANDDQRFADAQGRFGWAVGIAVSGGLLPFAPAFAAAGSGVFNSALAGSALALATEGAVAVGATNSLNAYAFGHDARGVAAAGAKGVGFGALTGGLLRFGGAGLGWGLRNGTSAWARSLIGPGGTVSSPKLYEALLRSGWHGQRFAHVQGIRSSYGLFDMALRHTPRAVRQALAPPILIGSSFVRAAGMPRGLSTMEGYLAYNHAVAAGTARYAAYEAVNPVAWQAARSSLGRTAPQFRIASPSEVVDIGQGDRVQHFTDLLGASGITGVPKRVLSRLESGQQVVVGSAHLKPGINTYLTGKDGGVGVTKLGADAPPVSLDGIGVFGARQQYAIEFSAETVLSSGVRLKPVWAERSIGSSGK